MPEMKKLISQLDAINIEINALKSFLQEQIYIIKKSVEDVKKIYPLRKRYFFNVQRRLSGKNTVLKKAKKTKTTIIKTLTENINSRRILKADSNDFITISSKVKGIDKRNLCNDEKTTTSEEETSL